MYNILLCIAGLFLVDKLLLRRFTKNSSLIWYILHALVNLLVCIAGFGDVKNILINPGYQSLTSTVFAKDIVLAAHIYHILSFKVTIVDWIHHIVMCSILTASYVFTTTVSITNYLLFFLSGLPGGIDYVLLSLVKAGKMDKLTEKKINSKLNIWIRAPGILVGAYIFFYQYFHGIIDVSRLAVIASILAFYWNAQYFTERVVFNYGMVYGIQCERNKWLLE